jgi:hypothetical protein
MGGSSGARWLVGAVGGSISFLADAFDDEAPHFARLS